MCSQQINVVMSWLTWVVSHKLILIFLKERCDKWLLFLKHSKKEQLNHTHIEEEKGCVR
jgi:hypothetical protein